MKLLEEIEQGAASEDMPIASLLRKCLILVSRLGSKPAEAWVERELNGYPKEVPVPPYRVLPLIIVAHLADIVKQIPRQTIPPAVLGERADKWTRHDYRSGIGAIEHLLRGNNSMVTFEIENLPLFLAQQEAIHMEIISAWGEVSSSQVKNILDTVRNRVLKFALDIGKEYPDAGEVRSPTTGNTERVNQIFFNTIHGSANVIGNASNSSVVLNVTQGDFASLKQVLVENAVTHDDIMELKSALDEEPELQSRAYGPKVSAWLGKMVRKAAQGTWQIATGAAGSLLSTAISRYYGIT